MSTDKDKLEVGMGIANLVYQAGLFMLLMGVLITMCLCLMVFL